MVHRSRNSSQSALRSSCCARMFCSATASSRSRAASGQEFLVRLRRSISENSPRRPRAHSSRQASSCSLKARPSASSCREAWRRAGRDSYFTLRDLLLRSAIHFHAPRFTLVFRDSFLRSSRFIFRACVDFHFARIAASISSAVCGSAASRSINLPSAPTRKSHSMRTPSLSSGI